MKVDILAVGVHPDDIELGCSGTIAKHVALGKTVGLLDLSRGELGTRGSAALRSQEAGEAAKILGVAFRTQLNFKDGFFLNDEAHQRVIVEHIRKHQPEVVLCNAVSDRHPDHGRAARLVSEACFYSGLAKVQTVCDGQAQKHWRPRAVYHYIQDHFIHPDFVIDVTPFMEVRMRSILAYASQFYDPRSTEPATPISGKDFLDSLNAKMAIWGRAIGANFAEGFTTERYPGVTSFDDLL